MSVPFDDRTDTKHAPAPADTAVEPTADTADTAVGSIADTADTGDGIQR